MLINWFEAHESDGLLHKMQSLDKVLKPRHGDPLAARDIEHQQCGTAMGQKVQGLLRQARQTRQIRRLQIYATEEEENIHCFVKILWNCVCKPGSNGTNTLIGYLGTAGDIQRDQLSAAASQRGGCLVGEVHAAAEVQQLHVATVLCNG